MERQGSSLPREILGAAAAVLALLLVLSLVSFSPADEGLLGRELPVANWVGATGVWLSNKILIEGFGLAAYLFPLVLVTLSAWAFVGAELPPKHKLAMRGGAFFAFAVFSAVALHLSIAEVAVSGESVAAGGLLGTLLGEGFRGALNVPGAAAVTVLGLLVSFMVLTHITLSEALGAIRSLLARMTKALTRAAQERRTRAELEKREEHVSELREQMASAKVTEEVEIAPPLAADEPAPVQIDAKIRKPKKKPEKKDKKKTADQEAFEFAKQPAVAGEFALPSTELLDPEPDETHQVDEEQLKANAKILEKKLLDFNIKGQVVAIEPGPVITMYEFMPAPGVKVSKVAGLQDDLAMALSAVSIRIIAPIPGKNVIGIEIPNKHRETIYLRDMMENDEFQKNKSHTLLALGKDTSGIPYYWDLKKMPHLLVAGATGAGKSVGINTMILSMLFSAHPRDVRFILVDPKMLELSVYDGIPHLYSSVVTDPKQAAGALRWAVLEMERRYKLLSDYGVRNIDNFNKAVRKEVDSDTWRERARRRAEEDRERILKYGSDEQQALACGPIREEDLQPPEELPYLVIIIDELADLMMLVGKEIEESIARLAQMARAAGIHMILATQRPSVDVITGLIKANFPTRISFQVTSRTDSRTILDSQGAEQLLGRGDMLFSPPGSSKLVRVHGAFVSDEEVHRVVEYLKEAAGEVEYNDAILNVPAEGKAGAG
ncbi:MAG: DNA translocase FtsK 4TM domain-containing protein, partial [Chrysiogenetes bacterium]|nr:DNA translocase FtsK 4TM domain-containing protein [Chrysiogenetes bacterium]